MGERPTSYTKCFQISLRLAPEERLHRLKRQLHFGNFQNGITSNIWFSYRHFRFPSLYGINPWITNYRSVTLDAGTPIRMNIRCNLVDNWNGWRHCSYCCDYGTSNNTVSLMLLLRRTPCFLHIPSVRNKILVARVLLASNRICHREKTFFREKSTRWKV